MAEGKYVSECENADCTNTKEIAVQSLQPACGCIHAQSATTASFKQVPELSLTVLDELVNEHVISAQKSKILSDAYTDSQAPMIVPYHNYDNLETGKSNIFVCSVWTGIRKWYAPFK